MLKVPDLASGFIVHGIDAANSWTTEIQSVLGPEDGDADDHAYLAYQCRNERVWFADDGERKGSIIKTEHPFEFLTYTKGGHFYQLPSCDTVVAPSQLTSVELVRIEESLLLRPYTEENWTARVVCPWVETREVGFEDLLDGLRNERVAIRNLFIELRFSWDGRRYRMVAPCRYVNFAHRELSRTPYLQPITGYVLMPFRDWFLNGYVVAAMDGTQTVAEFVAPRYADMYRLLELSGGVGRAEAPLLENLAKVVPGIAPVFNLRLRLDAEARFFRYAG